MQTAHPPSHMALGLGRKANLHVGPSSQPQLSSPYLVRKAGGRGAATVIGDGRGQVPQRAAHSRVDTVASTLVLVTALGLPKGRYPVWGAGGWGHLFALLLLAG